MLKKNNGHVFVWIQAVEDFAYLQKLPEYIDGGITPFRRRLLHMTCCLRPVTLTMSERVCMVG